MKINLSVPPLSLDSVEFVQTNPGTLATDLAALPHKDFLYSGYLILNDLSQFNRASVDDDLRLKLLDVYRVSILNLAKRLRKSIGKSNLPVNKKLLTKLKLTLDLHTQLMIGYKRIILNQDMSEDSNLSNNNLIIASERTIFSLLEIITLSYLSYTPILENSWKELHTIFLLAHQKGFSGIKIQDIADSSKKLKILDIYLYALLLGLSEPYGLPNGSLYSLMPYFHLWISYLSLFDKNNLEGLRYTYRIDPDIDKPFLPFVESRPEGKLYVTTDSLIHQMFGPNPPLIASNDDNAIENHKLFRRAYFPKLITSWTNYPIRRYQRNSASGEMQLIAGFENVINILRPEEKTMSKDEKKLIQRWQIINDSATGIGVEYKGHEVTLVNVGGLVLYRTDEIKTDDSWATGIIRRFTQSGRSHLSMGIQRLPPDAHTGKLNCLNHDNKFSAAILMYAENPLLNSQATIIAPPNTFNPAEKFQVVLDNGREFRIRAIKTVQINPVLEQFTFEYLND
jgi:hypothetical protein